MELDKIIKKIDYNKLKKEPGDEYPFFVYLEVFNALRLADHEYIKQLSIYSRNKDLNYLIFIYCTDFIKIGYTYSPLKYWFEQFRSLNANKESDFIIPHFEIVNEGMNLVDARKEAKELNLNKLATIRKYKIQKLDL